MNHKILLRLVTVPTIAGSVLVSFILSGIASKAQATSSPLNQTFCSLPQSRLESPSVQSLLHRGSSLLIASRSNVLPDELAADFSEAESDAAVALFGCDCPACMNVLSQLRRQSLMPKGEGHCITNLAKRVSPQQVKEVLKKLETEAAKIK